MQELPQQQGCVAQSGVASHEVSNGAAIEHNHQGADGKRRDRHREAQRKQHSFPVWTRVLHVITAIERIHNGAHAPGARPQGECQPKKQFEPAAAPVDLCQSFFNQGERGRRRHAGEIIQEGSPQMSAFAGKHSQNRHEKENHRDQGGKEVVSQRRRAGEYLVVVHLAPHALCQLPGREAAQLPGRGKLSAFFGCPHGRPTIEFNQNHFTHQSGCQYLVG